MAEIGKYNTLRVVKLLDFGAYLDGEELGEILLPIKQVPENAEIDDELEVFLYSDSDDRIIATMIRPFAQVGDFAMLRCIAVEDVGAFLDWGLMKNLLVPFREQKKKLEVGRSYLVYVYLDELTDRIAATAKIEKYLDKEEAVYRTDDEVDLIIKHKTDLGYTAIIDNLHTGVLYDNEIFTKISVGEKMKGFVKKIREDKKIDLYLHPKGYEQVDGIAFEILQKIRKNGNFMAFTDKSSPESIYDAFGVSKKNFKKAIGSLYKNKLITLEETGIRYVV